MSIKELVKKEIEYLPENLIEEVYDFILFVEKRRQMNLAKTAQELSIQSFLKIWDNEEDSVYDNV